MLIANAGGIVAILSGMKDHIDHAGVQEQGCGALRNLANNVENRVSIANAGGMIAAIVSGMKAHTDHAGVQEQGCGALANLATNDDIEVLIANAGGILAAILSGMHESPYRPHWCPRTGMRCTHQSCYQ